MNSKRSLTQTELMTKLNLLGWDVSRDIIARIEGQVRWVADFEVVKLASAFGIDGPELLRRAVTKAHRHPQSLPGLLKKNN
jgi:hypothetical protein